MTFLNQIAREKKSEDQASTAFRQEGQQVKQIQEHMLKESMFKTKLKKAKSGRLSFDFLRVPGLLGVPRLPGDLLHEARREARAPAPAVLDPEIDGRRTSDRGCLEEMGSIILKEFFKRNVLVLTFGESKP